jgi:hypothetical protein
MGVGPTDLRSAFELLENTDCGRRIAEGLKSSGVGAAIAVDARELLVEGELDKDCDDNFMIAAESILSTGVEDAGDMGFFLVNAQHCPLDARENDMPRMFLDGVMKLSDALTHWSTRRASEEIKSLIELVDHMGRNLAIFDATRNHVCFQALSGARMELAKCFLGVSTCEWPPPVLPDLGIIEGDGPEDETNILKLCRSLLCFLRGGMPKAASLDATLQIAVKNLETEAVKLQNHVVLRQSMWKETKAMETLLSAVWDPSDGGFSAMLAELAHSSDGFFDKLLAVIACRPPAVNYLESLFLPSCSDVRFETGCDLVPFSSPQKFADFVKEWHVGHAVDHIARKFFFDQCDRIANDSLAQFTVALGNFILPVTKIGVAEGGSAIPSPLEVLRTLLPKFAVDKLSEGLELPTNVGDFNMITLLDSALGTLAAKPLEIAMGVYDPLTLRTQITMDSSEVCTDLVLAMFECYKHVTNVVQVASALSVQVLSSSATTMVKSTTASGASTWEIRSTIALSFGWLEGACGLTWLQLKTRGVVESKFSELRFRIELLDDVIQFIQQVWLPSAQQHALYMLSTTLAKQLADIQARTPTWGHIVSASRYNQALAKKQLLSAPQHLIVDLIDSTTNLVTKLTDLSKQFGNDPSANNTLAEADGILESTKLTMTIIAGVNALENYNNTVEGARMATQLLLEKQLPEAMRSRLRLLANCQG